MLNNDTDEVVCVHGHPVTGHGDWTRKLEHLGNGEIVHRNDSVESSPESRLDETLGRRRIGFKVRINVGIDKTPTDLRYDFPVRSRYRDKASLTRRWTRIRESVGVATAGQSQCSLVGLEEAIAADKTASSTQFRGVDLLNQICPDPIRPKNILENRHKA